MPHIIYTSVIWTLSVYSSNLCHGGFGSHHACVLASRPGDWCWPHQKTLNSYRLWLQWFHITYAVISGHHLPSCLPIHHDSVASWHPDPKVLVLIWSVHIVINPSPFTQAICCLHVEGEHICQSLCHGKALFGQQHPRLPSWHAGSHLWFEVNWWSSNGSMTSSFFMPFIFSHRCWGHHQVPLFIWFIHGHGHN